MSEIEERSFVRSHLEENLHQAGLRQQEALDQIDNFGKQINELEIMYQRACRNRAKDFKYKLRLRLSVINGIKRMLYHYSAAKQKEIDELRLKLFGPEETVEIGV